MHILLTDILACPRCGPGFGLIVLADAMRDRSIVEGRLGCPNCREDYPVRSGVVDLRTGPVAEVAGASGKGGVEERGVRVAALLGVGEARGPILLRTDDEALVAEVGRLLPNAQLVGVRASAPAAGGLPGVDWVLAGDRLPVRSGVLIGAAIAAADPRPLLAETARALAAGGRLVVDPAPPGTGEAMAAEGLDPLLEQEGVAVASSPRAR